MALYEYKGQQYDIETDDPVLAKNKILKYLETGEGESKPKSAQQAPIEGAGGAAFGVYRPQGRRPENQNRNREENKDMAIQTIRGALSAPITGALGLPVDMGNIAYGQAIKPAFDFAASQFSNPRMSQYSDLPPAIQSAGNLMGGAYNTIVRGQEFQPLPQVPKAEKIPGIGDYGMNFYNQFVPGPDPENAAQQMAFAGSQALTGGLANRVVGGAIAAPRVIRGGANQVRTGAMEGVTNPVQRAGPNTAFAELTDQVYPNTTVKPYMKLTPEQQVQGLPALEASRQPSNSLFSGFLDKAALRLAPEGPAGGKLVPLEGRGLQAFTEQTTRDLFNKPSISNLGGFGGNIGGAIAGGLVGNLPGAVAGFFAPQSIRALNLLGQRRLQNKAALQPEFQQQLGQAQQTAGRIGLEGSMPQTPLLGYNPRSGGGGAAGPVPPTMYVNPAGQATTNLAGTQVNMNPGSLAAPTAAATAAMATTQRVATGQPRTPRAQEPFTMPTAQETFDAATAARPSHQTYEAAADAVAQRTKDILKQARIEGRNLSPEAAANIADDEIRAVRFPKKSEAAGPKLAQEGENPALVKTPGEGTLDKPNVEFDRTDWFALQEKVRSGKPLTAGDQSLADKITGRYGPDPFGSGDLTGQKMFNTVAQGETTPVAATAPTSTAEVPVVETPKQTRDTTKRNAKKELLKSLDDDSVDIDKALSKYESKINRRQMDIYLDALKQAEGKADPESLANYALRQNNLPTFDGSVTESRIKPSPNQLQERALAQAWYDDTIKNADKQTKQMYKELLDKKNGDVAQLYREISSKPLGKSFFEEPLNTAMPETKPTPVETKPTPKIETPTSTSNLKRSGTFGEKNPFWENPDFRNVSKELSSKIPKDIKWVKQTNYEDSAGVGRQTEHISQATKTHPEYKFVDKFINEADDLSELYVKKNGKWELVYKEKRISEENPTPHEPMNFKHYKDFVVNGSWNEGDNSVFKGISETTKQPMIMVVDKDFTTAKIYKQNSDGTRTFEKGIDLKEAQKAERKAAKAAKSAPKDAMEMKTGNKVFDNKADFEAQSMLDKIAGKPTTGSFVDNGLRYEISAIDYGTTPRKVLEGLNKPLTQVRIFSERTNKQISGPAADVPEKPLRQRIEEQRKRK